jgi:hypothetical protein
MSSRRTLPESIVVSCALHETWSSPVVMYSMPSGPKWSVPPLWFWFTSGMSSSTYIFEVVSIATKPFVANVRSPVMR